MLLRDCSCCWWAIVVHYRTLFDLLHWWRWWLLWCRRYDLQFPVVDHWWWICWLFTFLWRENCCCCCWWLILPVTVPTCLPVLFHCHKFVTLVMVVRAEGTLIVHYLPWWYWSVVNWPYDDWWLVIVIIIRVLTGSGDHCWWLLTIYWYYLLPEEYNYSYYSDDEVTKWWWLIDDDWPVLFIWWWSIIDTVVF